jgi:predicted dehydrogenase
MGRTEQRALRYGMVGGGPGAFIGDVHRRAIALEGGAELVAGAFSRSHEKTLAIGRELMVDQQRCYAGYEEMAEKESSREDGIDFVVIVTPNASHFPVAKSFLEHGIHVVCDKPLTTTLKDAESLGALVDESGLLFGVTYTYTGYPLVKHARALVASGELGAIRFVNAEYPQEWLSTAAESTGENRQAEWRTDPTQSGPANCVGDIGTHIENMVSYVTGLRILRLSARLDSFVEGRRLDDNATVMVDYDTGATGLYWSSQVAVGCINGLRLRVFCEKGSLEFLQERPDLLRVHRLDEPTQLITRGRDTMLGGSGDLVRVPAGHPEGYFEAFANIYHAYMGALRIRLRGGDSDAATAGFPTVDAGIQGVRFVTRVVESSTNDAKWVEF